MKKLIKNGSIYSPARLPENYGILIEDGLFSAVDQVDRFPTDIPIIDAQGKTILPGLIDIHVHGANGYDTMDTHNDALTKMSQYFASKGVTSYLPTTVTASSKDITAAVDQVVNYQQISDGARILGVHLEGPFLEAKHKGAQPEQHLRPADPKEYMPWLDTGFIKLFTVAPDVDGVYDLITKGRKLNVFFAVGHSSASYEQMVEAIDRGLTQVTHTFNGMPSLHHREPGILGAVLTDDRVYTQVIADGIHLHPAIVKLIFKVKGVEKTVLITDAIRATGMQDGKYGLGDQLVEVKNGIARTDSGSLAGSTLTMNRALKNACSFTGYSLEEILPSATSIAAKSINMSDQIGSIKPGFKADLVIMDDDFEPQLTMVSGNIVYQKNN